MMFSVNHFFINADKVCDMVPVLSAAAGVVNLIQKIALLIIPNTWIARSDYYSYLNDKSFVRCFASILVPIFYNVYSAEEFRLHKWRCPYYVLYQIDLDSRNIVNAAKTLIDDSRIFQKAIDQGLTPFLYWFWQMEWNVHDFFHYRKVKKANFALELIRRDVEWIRHISPDLGKNPNIVKEAINQGLTPDLYRIWVAGVDNNWQVRAPYLKVTEASLALELIQRDPNWIPLIRDGDRIFLEYVISEIQKVKTVEDLEKLPDVIKEHPDARTIYEDLKRVYACLEDIGYFTTPGRTTNSGSRNEGSAASSSVK